VKEDCSILDGKKKKESIHSRESLLLNNMKTLEKKNIKINEICSSSLNTGKHFDNLQELPEIFK